MSAFLNWLPNLASKLHIKSHLDVVHLKPVKLFKTSGDHAAESCPTYAVVDNRKKKKVAEMDQESSADIALYAVVNKAKKKSVFSPDIHKSYDENEYSTAEVKCTVSHATREEESQPTYSVLERDKSSKVVLSKTSLSFNRFGDKDKFGKYQEVFLRFGFV